MRRLNISQSIGDICSRYENSDINNGCNNNRKWLISSASGSSSFSTTIGSNYLQKSSSEVICKRGFKPSDRHDPQKRRFLNSLTTKFWKKSPPPTQPENGLRTDYMESSSSGVNERKIDLKKLFTPAPDFQEDYICPKKMYASSSFYSPNHPTVEEQLELARRISRSLSDISNQRSKGQSMYVNRKKRSVKWVHEGEGKGAPLEEESSVTEEESEAKNTLKLVMNPRGHVQDLQSLRRLGYNVEAGALSPEICFDLVKDMQATKGKGAELFAKRRKKSEKWIIQSNGTQDAANDNKGATSSNPMGCRFNGTDCHLQTIQTSETSRHQQEWSSDYNVQTKSSVSSNQRCYNSSIDGNNGSNESKFKFTEELYKPKIPRAWNAAYEKQPSNQAVYDCRINGDSSTSSPSATNTLPRGSNFLHFAANNYNTAARGWQPSMQYYRPVTFQKRLSYTDF